jgi:carboxypeptidase family protein/TonB-dependent receptor-like protein
MINGWGNTIGFGRARPRAKRVLVAALLGFGLLFYGAARVEAAVDSATLSGTVVLEQDGSPLPGVTVTATDEPRGITSTAVTDGAGKFRISLLRPSTYTVTAELTGFGAYRRTGEQLVVGQEAVVRIPLRPAAAAAIEVRGQVELIDPTASQISSSVTPQQVRDLPLPTRNYLDLALLAPGTSPGRDVAFSGRVSGGAQEARWTYVSLDGADNNNFIVGGQQSNISQDTIQEFQVLNYNFSAEYGRSNALVVNVLTKSGSNDPHGTAYYYYRGKSFTDDQFVPPKNAAGQVISQDGQKRENWGGTIGGPIAKDTAFFFGSFDKLNTNIPLAVSLVAAAPAALNETVPITHDEKLFFGKVDIAASSSQRLNLSYRYDKRDDANLGVGQNRFAASYGYAQLTKTQGAIASHQWVPTGTFSNELRLGYLDFHQDSTPNTTQVGQMHPSYSFGQNFRFPQGGNEKRYSIDDGISVNMGKNFFKVGAGFSYWKADDFFALFSGGQFRFTSDNPAAPPLLFIKGLGNPATTDLIRFYNVYAQDEFRATDRLTINAGLRWDYADGASNSDFVSPFGLKTPTSEDKNNVAPRLGFAYVVNQAHNTTIRGGGGIFYFEIFNNLSLNEDIFNGEKFRIAAVVCPRLPGGCDVNNPPDISKGLPQPSDVRANEANLQTPYTVTYSLGTASELGGGWAASLDGVYSRGYHEFGEIRENLRVDPNDITSARPDPRIGSIRRIHSGAGSWYYALLTSIRKAFSEKWQAQISYTYSHAINESEFFGVAASNSRLANPFNADSGNARTDQRHRFVLNSAYELPLGFNAGTILTVASGQPWSARSGVDINNDDASDQDRPPGFSRNDQTSASYFRWDVRLAKRFQIGPVALDLIGEVFNLTNHKNFDPSTYFNVIPPDVAGTATKPASYSSNFPIPATFGQPGQTSNDFYQPRQFQVAARISF